MDRTLKSGQGLTLPAHLSHVQGEAWFDPIPLTANLPSDLRNAGKEHWLKYIHEYVHFLQASSTFFGANRMHTFFWSMSSLRKLLQACDGQLAKLDLNAFVQQASTKHQALEQITKASQLENDGEQLLAETEYLGFHQVDTGEMKFPALLRQIRDNIVSVAPIGIRALQENMALAVERWTDLDQTQELYHAIVQLENWQHFDYASVSESLRSIGKWDEETIIWVTVVICDVALDHYLPLHAFTLAFTYLRDHYSDFSPKIEQLPQLHQQLRTACYIDLAEEDRGRLSTELKRIVSLPDADSAPSDWIFAKYFQLYLDAFAAREKKQHAFVERLLYLQSTCPPDLKDFEGIPFYTTAEGLISSRSDTDLVTAGLAIICMQHFSRYLSDLASKNPIACKQCPLLEKQGVCDYPKGMHCHEYPWYAPEENGQSCVYRFATDALGVRLYSST